LIGQYSDVLMLLGLIGLVPKLEWLAPGTDAGPGHALTVCFATADRRKLLPQVRFSPQRRTVAKPEPGWPMPRRIRYQTNQTGELDRTLANRTKSELKIAVIYLVNHCDSLQIHSNWVQIYA
jgi:hypothetical protein